MNRGERILAGAMEGFYIHFKFNGQVIPEAGYSYRGKQSYGGLVKWAGPGGYLTE